MKVAVLGASGYAGTELLRLCATHPDLEVVAASAASQEGRRVAEHTPSLAAAYPELVYGPTVAGAAAGCDVVFLALPHGASQHLVPALLADPSGPTVIDLGADFRLRDPDAYPRWYGEAHTAPELLADAVYGLPELHRDRLGGARLVAVPGCYPTATALALAPLVEAGLLATTPPVTGGADAGAVHGDHPGTSALVVDAASGVSGAGRAASDRLHFGHVDEDFTAYGLLDHRHTAEMEQELGASVLFTPHLAPMVRGILVTAYARPAPGAGRLTTEGVLGALRDRYAGEPFVVVTDAPPSTKATTGSNTAHVTARVDGRTGWVVALAAIDNLVKGAAGQAVQCANVVLGLPEARGLPAVGTYP